MYKSLLEYATDRQVGKSKYSEKELVEALVEEGSQRKVAALLGIGDSTVERCLDNQKLLVIH